LLLNFAAERYWVQNVMTQILAIVWVPSWFHTYSIVFPRRAQYVECTQYMATRTAILNVGIGLNQCLEEIAKKEAPASWSKALVRRGTDARTALAKVLGVAAR
jgi:hypothetical protein